MLAGDEANDMSEEPADSWHSMEREQAEVSGLRSRHLSEKEIRAALDALPGFFLKALPDSILTATYEWGCCLHYDLCYQPMRVGVAWLDRFLAESVEQRIFVPGDSDMTISAPDKRLSILFCHEGDLHVGGTDTELLRCFLSTAPYVGLQIRDVGVSN